MASFLILPDCFYKSPRQVGYWKSKHMKRMTFKPVSFSMSPCAFFETLCIIFFQERPQDILTVPGFGILLHSEKPENFCVRES